jgi:hypothetical protein
MAPGSSIAIAAAVAEARAAAAGAENASTPVAQAATMSIRMLRRRIASVIVECPLSVANRFLWRTGVYENVRGIFGNGECGVADGVYVEHRWGSGQVRFSCAVSDRRGADEALCGKKEQYTADDYPETNEIPAHEAMAISRN